MMKETELEAHIKNGTAYDIPGYKGLINHLANKFDRAMKKLKSEKEFWSSIND